MTLAPNIPETMLDQFFDYLRPRVRAHLARTTVGATFLSRLPAPAPAGRDRDVAPTKTFQSLVVLPSCAPGGQLTAFRPAGSLRCAAGE